MKSSTAMAAGTVLASNLGMLPSAHASGSDILRVGLVGCGPRGRGAVEQCLTAAPGVRLVALGDAFRDRVDSFRKRLEPLGDNAKVPESHCFVGLDAIDKVLAADVDYVILTTPPGFRPDHIQAAIAAGKHVFAEKPVAVDSVGVRKCLAACEEAERKGLGIISGTQRRHQTSYREALKRIHDGEIGEIVAGRCYWNQGKLGVRERKPSWSDLEYQIRNWLYFTWLSGDHILEQHVHNIDVINWAMRTHPIRAVGMGGRQVRIEPKYGHIFDHFAVDFEYPNGVHLMSMCRQIDGCDKIIREEVIGTKGACSMDWWRQVYGITGERPWHFPKEQDNLPYVQEHTDLINSIRAGKPLNELRAAAESCLTAVMGRMSAYTGKTVNWDQAMGSNEDLKPAKLDWAMKLPIPAVPVPGQTPLS
jgi:predicted dehydrogenase